MIHSFLDGLLAPTLNAASIGRAQFRLSPEGVTVTCLGRVVGRFESRAPSSALPALTKMPCRCRCEPQWQGGGIHRSAAGSVLHSLVSSLPIGFSASDR